MIAKPEIIRTEDAGPPELKPTQSRRLAFLLTLLSVSSAIFTYWVLAVNPEPLGSNPAMIILLSLINLVLLLALTAVVARQVIGLWGELRSGSAGSRLQTRIVVMFSIVAIVPTVLVSVFSAVFFNFGIKSWFDERVSAALNNSLAVAEAYLEEHKNNIRADVLSMAFDLGRNAPGLVGNPKLLARAVNSQAAMRGLTEAVLFQRNRVLARSDLSFALAFEKIPLEAIERAAQGDVVIITDETDERVRALVKLEGLLDTFLLVGRFVDSRAAAHVERTQGAVHEYQRLQNRISSLQIEFSFVFILVALLLLLAAIWYGLIFAGNLVRPIRQLVTAAERVRGGDWTARVIEGPHHDEIAALGRAFNRMTSQIATQQSDLVEANRQLDMRRRMMEAVLTGASSGILALDAKGCITVVNRSGQTILGQTAEDLKQKHINDILPGAVELLEAMAKQQMQSIEREFAILRDDRELTLHVRVTGEMIGDAVEGYVVTIDDITNLVAAQRKAAWADVARRIAHEIKNPLTPIQLATQRLKKKYSERIPESEQEAFLRYLDTISRNIGDIQGMVEEFVAFARMPSPKFARENLTDLVQKSVFSQQYTHSDISYTQVAPEKEIIILCDGGQLRQILTNLLKNAAESIEDRKKKGEVKEGHIEVELKEENGQAVITIRDNGCGFPSNLLQKASEPYVTTKEKGSGLGLAIVKKIVEDHHGEMLINNNKNGGATVRVCFPVDKSADRDMP